MTDPAPLIVVVLLVVLGVLRERVLTARLSIIELRHKREDEDAVAAREHPTNAGPARDALRDYAARHPDDSPP